MTSKDETFLDWARVPGYEKVYAIASTGKRVNVCAQQCRSLNLAWALHERWRKNGVARQRVWVLGAGAGGLTCAAALALADAQVTVFDRSPEPMHLQLGCHHRFLHPRIVEWPDQHSTMAGANLPILDWVVGTAHDVRRRIVDQYEEIFGYKGLNPRPVVVSSFKLAPDGRVEPAQVDAGTSRRRELEDQPDLVILALGFGIEKTANFLPRQSYWRLDALDQSPIDTEDRPRRVLVCGGGDGGAIDFLRVALRSFDHGPFLDGVCEMLDGVSGEVSRIEADAGAMRAKLLTSLGNTPQARFVVDDTISRYLHRRYSDLETQGELQELQNALRAELRPETRIDWSGFGAPDYGMLFKTQPLNRLLAWQVLRVGSDLFHYRQEKIREVRVLDQEKMTGERYSVDVVGLTAAPEGLAETNRETRGYHEVIVRYGTESPLAASFPGIHLALAKRAPPSHDPDGEMRDDWLLDKQASALWWQKSQELPSRRRDVLGPPLKLGARLLRSVGEMEHEGTTLCCQKIRLYLLPVDRLYASVAWVDYLLHTKHDRREPLRRRAARGVAALENEPFALSVFTWDDYDVEAKLSDGSVIQRVTISSLLEEHAAAHGADSKTTAAVESLRKAKDLLEAEHRAGKDVLLGTLRASAHRLRDKSVANGPLAAASGKA
jgi:hypothetical protein